MSPARRKEGMHAKRIHEINEAFSKQDIKQLRKLATSGPGLVNDGLRRLVWPLLLSHARLPNISSSANKPQTTHRDARQLKLDVDRSSNYCTTATRQGIWKQKRHQLNDVALYVLQSDPDLHYYQGFHDVCSVFLNVLGDTMAKEAALIVAHTHLKDAMHTTLDPIMHQMQLLYPIIQTIDAELAEFLIRSETPVYFALSWVLSWFSHNIPCLTRAARLYDLFIASNPIMPLYVAAQVVIAQRDELLAGECEFTVVHHHLSNIRTEIVTDQLLEHAVQHYRQYPIAPIQKNANHFLDIQSCPIQYSINYPEYTNYDEKTTLIANYKPWMMSGSYYKIIRFIHSHRIMISTSTTVLLAISAAYFLRNYQY